MADSKYKSVCVKCAYCEKYQDRTCEGLLEFNARDCKKGNEEKMNKEEKVRKLLDELNFNRSSKGRCYIKWVLLNLTADEIATDYITKGGGIYDRLAKQFNDKISRVSRAISHCKSKSKIEKIANKSALVYLAERLEEMK